MKILVCENETMLLKLLSRELTKNGFEVISATNANVGLKLLKKEKPDIVITDLFIPMINGLEFIELILKENKSTEVIVYSDIVSEKFMEQAYRLGAHDFITKPFDPERLVKRIKRLDVYQKTL